MDKPKLNFAVSGLQCDAKGCDYKDLTERPEEMTIVGWYSLQVGKHCPKCGETLMTQEDFNTLKAICMLVDAINLLPLDTMRNIIKALADGDDSKPAVRMKLDGTGKPTFEAMIDE